MRKIKVGIIGCGTIGTALAKALSHEFRHEAELAYLCDRRPDKADRLRKILSRKIRIVSIERLIQQSDLVIEAASAKVSAEIAKKALRQGKDVLIMSVGGLSPLTPGGRGRGKLWIPSGALAGLDGLLAAREGRLRRVKLVTTKPPATLREAPYFKRRKFPALNGAKARCLFRGTALQAVRAFPQNINVAAALSLAGLGPRRTHVEIWTSPFVRTNRHEIWVEGDFGRIRTTAENVPSPENPKTSHLAVLSARATLRKIFSSVHIGT